MIPAWAEGPGRNKNVLEIRRNVGRVRQNGQKNLGSVQTTKRRHHDRPEPMLAAVSSANAETKLPPTHVSFVSVKSLFSSSSSGQANAG